MSHTQERLVAGTIFISEIAGQPIEFHCVGVDGTNLAVAITGIVGNDRDETSSADARRIAACWNACEGIKTGILESITLVGDTLLKRFAERDKIELELTTQRDELLEAIKELLEFPNIHEANEKARAAITKATGGDK